MQAVVLERLAGEDNPYADLLDALASELFYIGNENVWPSMKLLAANEEKYGHWLGLVGDFGIMRQAAMSEDLADNPLLKRLERKLPGRARFAAKIALGVMEESRQARSMETYKQYETALARFSGITASRQFAHQIARAGFEDNPAEARSHLFAAHKAAAGLKAVLGQNRGVARPSDQKDPFWCLFQEPIDFLWQFSVAQAGCYLQDVWDEEVIIKTQGIHDRHRLSSMLFGGQGHIDQFMKAHARPHGFNRRNVFQKECFSQMLR